MSAQPAPTLPLSPLDEVVSGDLAIDAMLQGPPREEAVPILMRPLDEILQYRSSLRERYILTRIDGIRSIGAILQLSPMRDTEALEIFQALAGEGLIRY